MANMEGHLGPGGGSESEKMKQIRHMGGGIGAISLV